MVGSAGLASAQMSNFTELSVGGNIEFKSTTVKLSSTGSEFSGLGSQNIIGSVSADYGIAIGNDSVLLVGGKYDLQKTTIAKITDTGGSVELQEKNHYSLFVAPGIMLNDKVLGYAKLSYESSKASASVTTSVEPPTVTGMGYGVGIRSHLSGNWYANIEAARIVYSNKTIGDATLATGTTIGMFGLSYKF
jgi:hypothetical protein